MIQAGIADYIVKGTGGSGPGIACPINQFRDSRVDHCPGAHDTRLKRAIQRHAGKPIVCRVTRSLAHGDDFCVARGILSRNGLIVSAACDLAGSGDDNGAYRHLAGGQSFAGLFQRAFHEIVVHFRMLNYSLMKPLRRIVLVFLALSFLTPGGFAQGVRMPADFLPLDVGTRWTYDLTNEAGQKVGQMAFAVEEYTIVEGTSFYVLTEFPFTEEKGEPVRFIRYDRGERQFMRKLGADEGPLFLDSERPRK